MTGNDVFVGGGSFDQFIGEGGDDIFVGSDAQDKMEGMSGFDWVTYKNDRFGVSVDLRLPGEPGRHRRGRRPYCPGRCGVALIDPRPI